MVKVRCVRVGNVESAFLVDIGENLSAQRLKEEISRKFQSNENVKLFLAKKNGVWLTKAEAAAVILDGSGNLQGFEEINPTLSFKDTENFGENFQPEEENEVNVLAVLNDVSTDGRERKRMKLNDYPDGWIQAIMDTQVTVLPATCGDLREFLGRELRLKVPLSETSSRLVRTADTTGELSSVLTKTFDFEPRMAPSYSTLSILSTVIDPLWSGSDSPPVATYHHFWDSLIASSLRRVSKGAYQRFPDESSSNGPYRPNFCFYYNRSNVCIFRGEETASGSLAVPARNLHAQLTWKYDAAPYIFGYAAAGLQMRLVAITKDENTICGAKVETIATYDLSNLKDRISVFLAILNLSTLFRPVVELIQPLDRMEYEFIRRENGVQIEFAEKSVIKTYPPNMPGDAIIRKLKKLHQLMEEHSVPNVVELKSKSKRKKRVVLKPIGLLCKPGNVSKLLMALRDVLKALAAMHEINIMHRDLKWDNVLKYPGEGHKWFIIDFDEGALSPAAKVHHLNPESHAPEILSSTHTVKVDIWSVGFLVKTAHVQDLPDELKRMKKRCMQQTPSKRPTAKSLLETMESLLGN